MEGKEKTMTEKMIYFTLFTCNGKHVQCTLFYVLLNEMSSKTKSNWSTGNPTKIELLFSNCLFALRLSHEHEIPKFHSGLPFCMVLAFRSFSSFDLRCSFHSEIILTDINRFNHKICISKSVCSVHWWHSWIYY